MKTFIKSTFVIFFFLQNFSASAQPNKPARGEKLESLKIAFITQKLDLTSEEAKVFWPVYNHYQDELEALRKTRRANLLEAKMNVDELGDKEIEALLNNEFAFRQNELDITKKYLPEFKKILPIKKVARLYKSEEEWKRKLLQLLQERREMKGK